MSKHEIHGVAVNVNVCQGSLTEQARGRCIGKVVNVCRDASAVDFREYVNAAARVCTDAELPGDRDITSAFLDRLDTALASGYTKRYSDEFAPIASVELVEG